MSLPLPTLGTIDRKIIPGGGCMFISSCFARQISFQIDEFEFDLKRNLSGRTSELNKIGTLDEAGNLKPFVPRLFT